MWKTKIRNTATIATLCVVAFPAIGNDVAAFYGGKQIELIIAVSAGGGFDLNGRILANHIGKYVPGNPRIIVRNMPGAGGAVAANHMANVAPKDGTALSLPLSSILSSHLLTPERMRYDPAKFNWIGTIATISDSIAVWHTAPAKTIEEAKQVEVILGTSSRASLSYQGPAMVNALLGTKFRIIEGYRGATEMNLAMEQGELHGQSKTWETWKTQNAEAMAAGMIIHLIQIGSRIPELPNVPSLINLVKTEREKAMVEFLHSIMTIGRSIYAPPDVPRDRVAALREAFMATMKDPGFLAEMTARNASVAPAPGAELQAYVEKTMAMPKDVLEEVKKAIR